MHNTLHPSKQQLLTLKNLINTGKGFCFSALCLVCKLRLTVADSPIVVSFLLH